MHGLKQKNILYTMYVYIFRLHLRLRFIDINITTIDVYENWLSKCALYIISQSIEYRSQNFKKLVSLVVRDDQLRACHI
jgi:hypothetical protein